MEARRLKKQNKAMQSNKKNNINKHVHTRNNSPSVLPVITGQEQSSPKSTKSASNNKIIHKKCTGSPLVKDIKVPVLPIENKKRNNHACLSIDTPCKSHKQSDLDSNSLENKRTKADTVLTRVNYNAVDAKMSLSKSGCSDYKYNRNSKSSGNSPNEGMSSRRIDSLKENLNYKEGNSPLSSVDNVNILRNDINSDYLNLSRSSRRSNRLEVTPESVSKKTSPNNSEISIRNYKNKVSPPKSDSNKSSHITEKYSKIRREKDARKSKSNALKMDSRCALGLSSQTQKDKTHNNLRDLDKNSRLLNSSEESIISSDDSIETVTNPFLNTIDSEFTDPIISLNASNNMKRKSNVKTPSTTESSPKKIKVADQNNTPQRKIHNRIPNSLQNSKENLKQVKDKYVDKNTLTPLSKPKTSPISAAKDGGLKKNSVIELKDHKKSLVKEKLCNCRSEQSFSTDSDDGGKQKKTRGSFNTTGDLTAQKNSTKPDSIFNCLSSLTRKLLLRQVNLLGDVSTCDIEDIDVPEKFDLECKVISTFFLFDEDIQVIRVQDGFVCKPGTLVISECGSWKDAVNSILKGPNVKKGLPHIDIIIFNFTRMNMKIVPQRFYKIHNVMAVKLCLKTDPRKKNISKGELFFCVEGQNAYNRKLSKDAAIEIEKRISKKDFKSVRENLNKDAMDVERLKDMKNSLVPTCDDNSSSTKVSEKEMPKKKFVIESKSTSNDFVLVEVAAPEVDKNSDQNERIDDEPYHKEKKGGLDNPGHEPVDGVEKTKCLAEVNVTVLSDETFLSETPAVLKELSEIMHEESALGMPLTLTEDVHLKNSGSEVTFSQFCQKAQAKASNFRTSTQNNSVSPSATPEQEYEKSDEMEPLVYCPSGSSQCSLELSPINRVKKSQDLLHEECSESVLLTGKTNNIPVIKKNIEQGIDVPPVDIDESSVKLLSSNSSVLEYEVISGNKHPADNLPTEKRLNRKGKFSLSLSKTSDSSIKWLPKKYMSLETGTKKTVHAKNSNFMPENEEESTNRFVNENGNTGDRNEEIEILSDNSSVSFFSDEFTAALEKTPKSSSSQNKQPEPCGLLGEWLKEIPMKNLYQPATKSVPSIEAEVDNINEERDSSDKFYIYSHDRSLPFVDFEITHQLADSKCITTTVTFVSISPSIADKWQECFAKSRCTSCNKLYNVYNTFNNKYDSCSTSDTALSVRNNAVCPDSQCCNQILESSEFHFTVEITLKNGTPLSTLIGGKDAEEIFGCSAEEAARNEEKLDQVLSILRKISSMIQNKQPVQVDLTRVNIFNLNSGPLYFKKIYF